MNSTYNVPIIPQNLRREETYVQIADSLRYLGEVANDIFSRINKRIETNLEKLSSIQERIREASTKVERIAGETKAIQVFSSSKYPAAHINQRYISIFGCDAKMQPKRTKYKYSETVSAKEEPLRHVEYYHVKTKKSSDKYDTKGLGRIPADAESFSDLLLYNTGKNLYKNYILLDPLELPQRPRQREKLDKSHIEDAPVSISEETIQKIAIEESYFYSPNLGEVPILEVPLDLPDLPGIADDLRYENESTFAIAPSMQINTPPDSKPVDEFVQPDQNGSKIDQEVDYQNTNQEIRERHQSTPIKKTPPNEIIQNKIIVESKQEDNVHHIGESQEEHHVVNENKNKDQLPNIPLPPEINVENKKHTAVETPSRSKAELPPVANNDAHANLMDAIRKAGGMKTLKTINKKADKVPKSGGDLMQDLHAKLSLRRKGISGAKNPDAVAAPIDASSTLARLSERIPPPPLSSSEGEKDDTEDDEWDD